MARSGASGRSSGYLTAEYALMVLNVVLTLIKLFGIYRWLIWKAGYEKACRAALRGI